MTMLATFNFGLLGKIDAGLLFMEVLLLATSIFLMLLILVQRGKGGGLTGALGGMGGQSAFGSKAGDAFTKITVITAMIWITLCMLTIAAFNPPPRSATVVPDKLEAVDDADATVDDVTATESVSGSMSGSSDETAEETQDKGFQLDLDGPDDASDDSANSSDAGDAAGSENAADGDTSETESGSGGN